MRVIGLDEFFPQAGPLSFFQPLQWTSLLRPAFPRSSIAFFLRPGVDLRSLTCSPKRVFVSPRLTSFTMSSPLGLSSAPLRACPLRNPPAIASSFIVHLFPFLEAGRQAGKSSYFATPPSFALLFFFLFENIFRRTFFWWGRPPIKFFLDLTLLSRCSEERVPPSFLNNDVEQTEHPRSPLSSSVTILEWRSHQARF